MSTSPAHPRNPIARIGWTALGLVAVGVGGLGIIVPGLPTTVFFILAAWAFSKSSPRLEAWVLGLPRIGPLVQDYRDGLGMPRRAKITAVVMIVVFVSLSAWALDGLVLPAAVVALALIGIAVIWFRVPTKEDQLAG